MLCKTVSAQRVVLHGTAGAGSGASFGTGNGRTVVMPSPAFVDIDIVFSNTEARFMEYVVGLRAELQGRVTAGVIPAVRFTNSPAKWALYGMLGVPFLAFPRRLLGIETGGGVFWSIKPRFGLFFEAVVDMFVIGNDLPEGSSLVQLNGVLGIRVKFR